MSKNKLKEYCLLKKEISYKMKICSNLINFTITTVVAILTFAFKQKNPYFFVLPYCIIFPISLRVLYYRTSVAKISAYIIVFIEDSVKGLKWETINSSLFYSKGLLDLLRHCEFVFFCIVSFIGYISFRNSFNVENEIDCNLKYFMIIISIVEIVIMMKLNSVNEKRERFKQEFLGIKGQEEL